MNGVTIVNVVAFDVDKNKTITYSLEGITMGQTFPRQDIHNISGEVVWIFHQHNAWKLHRL